MFDESVWSMLVEKCQSIYQKHGLGIEIPTDNASDPVEVFDEVQVDKNVFRFVVYILWLKSQSDAFAKVVYTYMFRSDLWEDCKGEKPVQRKPKKKHKGEQA